MIVINIINLFKISYYSFKFVKNKVIEFFFNFINSFIYENIFIFRLRNKFSNIYFLYDLITFHFDYLLNDNNKIEFRFKIMII